MCNFLYETTLGQIKENKMKNILARGGIEFLAVFLGIALSFYVEQWQTDNEQRELLRIDCQNILSDINEDIVTINKITNSNNNVLNAGKNIISHLSNSDSLKADFLIKEINKINYPTFFGITRSYKLSYSTGRLNLYADEDLILEISKLYDHYYQRLELNGNVYDQVALNFMDSYVNKNIGYTQISTDYDKNKILDFFSDELFINQMLIFNNRVNVYLSRLKETESQLFVVKNQLEKYLGSS
jgi:hypothetical protein